MPRSPSNTSQIYKHLNTKRLYGKDSWLLAVLSMVWYALNEARAQKSNLAVIMLDIANAYGSIPHKLVVFALHRYGVSPQWIKLIETYYKGIFSKSFYKSTTRACPRHQQGIFAGCTFYNSFLGWYEHQT